MTIATITATGANIDRFGLFTSRIDLCGAGIKLRAALFFR
jgi:hypothetical protein